MTSTAAQDMGLPLTMTAAVREELGFYPDIFRAEALDIADLDSWRPEE